MTAPIAIIAGAGRFPFHVAEEAKRRGTRVVAFGLQGWVDPALAQLVDGYEDVEIGQLGRMIERLKALKITRAIMAGKVTKGVLLGAKTSFDAEALGVLSHVKDYSVPSLLGAIGERLLRDGITLLDSSTFLESSLCPEGVLTTRQPTAAELEDIAFGVQSARALAALDVGQTVIVKGRVIVAVEALEGTDAAVGRAHTLAGSGLVVVKTGSPAQDRRFDLPVIGMQTIETLKVAGVSCVAVEAGTTLLLDREALIASANAAGLTLVGVRVPASPS